MSTGKVKFITEDNVLVMNRDCTFEYYINDDEFVNHSLDIDAREHGVVRIGDPKFEGNVITQIVRWK